MARKSLQSYTLARGSPARSKIAVCEIYSVAHKNSFRWKWRCTDASGAIVVCVEEYEALFECVNAARARGYKPKAMWTSCANTTNEQDT